MSSYCWTFKDSSWNVEEVVEKIGNEVKHTFSTSGICSVTLEVETPSGRKAEIKDVRVRVVEVYKPPHPLKVNGNLAAISIGSGDDVTENPQNTPELVVIIKRASVEKLIAGLMVHFENATKDIDLSNLTADVNLTAGKSVIYMPSWPSVIEPSKILYIPSTGKGAVYICKNATSLDEVSIEYADVVIIVGETKEGMTVLTTLYNDTEYYAVFNVTGTGGGEFAPTDLDTKAPANPYPSISGTHNGTIKPNQTITVNKLYTYSCPGTSGHTESIDLYENGIPIANGTWNGYESDWHNITIHNVTDASYVTLLEDHEYNYTIITGSYPQIHHTDALPTANGWLNCSEFVDASGKRYSDWIPAIRLA